MRYHFERARVDDNVILLIHNPHIKNFSITKSKAFVCNQHVEKIVAVLTITREMYLKRFCILHQVIRHGVLCQSVIV